MSFCLSLFYPKRCIFCGQTGQDVCGDCAEKTPRCREHSGCIAPFFYEGNVRSAILRFKFHGQTSYAPVLARFMEECGVPEADLITWVPQSFQKYWRRGYNQAKLLAKEVARLRNMETERLLSKKNRPVQSKLSAVERFQNAKGAYRIRKKRSLSGLWICLVDDIYTTGATMKECERILKNAGADTVFFLTAAKTR